MGLPNPQDPAEETRPNAAQVLLHLLRLRSIFSFVFQLSEPDRNGMVVPIVDERLPHVVKMDTHAVAHMHNQPPFGPLEGKRRCYCQ